MEDRPDGIISDYTECNDNDSCVCGICGQRGILVAGKFIVHRVQRINGASEIEKHEAKIET